MRRVKGLYLKQTAVYEMRAKIRGFAGGRGCGKTEFGAFFCLTKARRGEPWMVVSPDYNVIEETTWPTFETVARQLGKWIRGVKSPVPRVWFRTDDGGVANIVFRGAEKPDKLRGPSKAGLWFDEASVMHHDAFLYGVPVLRWKRLENLPCLMTFTPKGRRHWTFDVFYEPVPDDEMPTIGTDGAALVGDLQQFAGRWYRRKAGTGLVQAHSSENPFLPSDYVHFITSHMSSALAAQEVAGNFVDLVGLMFQRPWFKLVDVIPRLASRARYWDRAATPGSGKYTAGVLMARTDDGLYWVEDVKRGQWSALERDQIIAETARSDAVNYGNNVRIYGEQEGGSAGKEISQQFIRMLSGFPVYRDIVGGKQKRSVDNLELPGEAKVVRAQPFAAQAEGGNVRVLRARWTEDYLEELIAFPESTYSDQVDASSGAFNKLATGWALDGGARERIPNQPGPSKRSLVGLQHQHATKRASQGNGGPP